MVGVRVRVRLRVGVRVRGRGRVTCVNSANEMAPSLSRSCCSKTRSTLRASASGRAAIASTR